MDLAARIQALGVQYSETKLAAVIQPRLTHNDAFVCFLDVRELDRPTPTCDRAHPSTCD